MTPAERMAALRRAMQPTTPLDQWSKGIGGAAAASGMLPRFAEASGLNDKERALLDYHRQNLTNATYLQHPEGGKTTVYVTGAMGPDGNIYNVPGYVGGKMLSEPEVQDYAARMGWSQFPSYPNDTTVPRDQHPANVAARALHQIIDADMQPRPRMNQAVRGLLY